MNSATLNMLLKHKDENVRILAKEYSDIMGSPYLDTYITMQAQLRDWNSQLKIGEEQIIKIGDVEVKTKKGKIDLFADKDEKSFERTFKYFSEIFSLTEALDNLRSKLTPEDKEKADSMVTDTPYEKAMNLQKNS